MHMRVDCCLVLLALAGGSCHARDIYVDNIGGNDRHRGEAPVANSVGGGPSRTIARALQLARPGDRIVLADTGEPYRECVTLHGARHSGSPSRPFVIVGNGATLDGSRPVHPELWEQFQGDIYRFRPARTSHQQMFLNDRPLVRLSVDNANMALPKLKPLEWCLLDRHIYLNLKKPVIDETAPPAEREDASVPTEVMDRAAVDGWRYMPQQYNLSYASHTVGITLYDVRNVVIANLTMQGFQLDGINAHDKAFNALLVGVTCRGNGRSGISIGGSSRVRITDSLMGSNGAAQLRCEGYSVTEVIASEILAHSAPSVVRDGAEVSIDGLPLKGEVLKEHVDPPVGVPTSTP